MPIDLPILTRGANGPVDWVVMNRLFAAVRKHEGDIDALKSRPLSSRVTRPQYFPAELTGFELIGSSSPGAFRYRYKWRRVIWLENTDQFGPQMNWLTDQELLNSTLDNDEYALAAYNMSEFGNSTPVAPGTVVPMLFWKTDQGTTFYMFSYAASQRIEAVITSSTPIAGATNRNDYTCQSVMRDEASHKWVADPNGTTYEHCFNEWEEQSDATMALQYPLGATLHPHPVAVGWPVTLYPAADGYTFAAPFRVDCTP